jgi:general secretion pathway protein F
MDAPASGRTGPAALADFIALNEEIAALVRARVPLEPHLARLGAELPGSAAKLAERIGGRLAAGDSLAAAMDAECTSLPAAYRAVIVAGAESGDLGSALESLVDTATRLDQMRRITGVALLYPLFVFVLVCLLIALIVSQVVPQFNWLHRSHFGLLPRLANSPLAVATIAFVLPIVALLIAAFWWRRSGRIHGNGTEQWGVLSRLPWIWRAQYWGHAATMADLLRLLIERGVPLDRAVCLAADATDDSQISLEAERLSEQIEQGNFGPSTHDVRCASRRTGFPMLIRLALYHASNRGLMTTSLEQAAGIYRERAILAAQWYADYMPILLTTVIGGTLTAGFALLVFWPYTATLRDLAQWNWK